MAGNRIDVTLSVNDDSGSLRKRNQEAKELNQNLSKAAQLAERALRPAARMQPQGEGTEYGRARGSMGTTGASARDFANQAQGLGGLVRVYATVAANLFAVTAAFNALKEAANTTNMIRGMDQLGAASGVALGTMAQRFAEATDGAISLREAMGSVTKASAAGLSSTQIIDIARFAKTASQALGLDMTDAVNRLTRGIVKLEPELLDELGLFTKIGPATEKYAAAVGRSVASLTDFERRQAFANAVLDEARQKFGQIELAANPYQKLEANIRNLTTAGLELVNTFLTPIVGLVSNNTTALVTVLGLIAAKLTNMAIPALAGWRDELVATAVEAKNRAAQINESFGEKFVQRTTSALKIPDITKDLNKVEAEFNEAKRKFLQEDNNIRQQARSKIISGLKEQEVSEETIARIKKDINKREDLTDAANQRHVASQQRLIALYEQKLLLQQRLNAAEQQAETQFQASNAEERARLIISQRAGARAERLSILSQVGANVESGGLRFALQELDKGVKQAADLKGWDRLRTRATGWAIAGASYVGVFLRALGGLGNGILMAVGIFTVLDGILSKNGESLNEFNSQAKQLNSTLDTAKGVTDKYGNSLSAAALNAKANVFTQLSSDVTEFADKLDRTIKDSNLWDRLKDRVLDLFGFGLQDEFAERTAKGIAAQLANMPEGELKKALEDKIKSILGTSGAGQADIEAALVQRTLPQAVELSRKLNAEAKKTGEFFQAANAPIVEVGESARKANATLSEIQKTFNNTDNVTKFGSELVKIALDSGKAFQNTASIVGTIDKLLEQPRVLATVDLEVESRLRSMREVYQNLAGRQDQFNNELNANLIALESLGNVDLSKATQEQINRIVAEKKRIEETIGNIKVKIEADKINITNIQAELNKIVGNTLTKGLQLTNMMVEAAIERSGLAISRNLLTGVSGPGISKAVADINIRELTLQQENNRLLAQLNNTLLLVQVRREKELAEQIKASAEEKMRKGEALTATERQNLAGATQTVIQATELQRRIGEGKGFTTKELEGVSALSPTVGALAVEFARTGAGQRQQEAETQSKIQIERDNARLGILREQQQVNATFLQNRSNLLQVEAQILELTEKGFSYLNDSQVIEKQAAERTRLAFQQAQAVQQVNNEIAEIKLRAKLAEEQGNAERAQILNNLAKQKEGQIGLLTQQQIEERNLLAIQQAQFRIANEFAKLNKQAEQQNTVTMARLGLEESSLQNQLELLEVRKQLGQVGEIERVSRERLIRTDMLANQMAQQVTQAAFKRDSDLRQLEQDRATARVAAQQANKDLDESEFTARKAIIDSTYKYEITQIGSTNATKRQILETELNYQMQLQKQFVQVFDGLTDRMTDAFMQFAQTGKLSFKELANSVIADIARIIIRAQTLQLLESVFGRGWQGKAGSFFANILTTSMSGGTGMTGSSNPAFSLAGSRMNLGTAGFGNAKGNAFSGALEMFAKGGMFTNKIVSEPTLFKFAKGTGLMGEAGPEAIMPLRRDSQGNLGVIAQPQQGNVEVVVNNYSNAQAETRETVDSRGNRKIEVVIGEMVAGEIGRKNSPVQQSMMANFMTKPATVRR